MADDYVTIRQTCIAKVVGARIIDVTQHDQDEYAERGAFVEFLFDNGLAVRVEQDPDGSAFMLTLTEPEAADLLGR